MSEPQLAPEMDVSDIDVSPAFHAGICGFAMSIPIEERRYRVDHVLSGNRQFVVADPDGYLLRFFSDLGDRPAGAAAS